MHFNRGRCQNLLVPQLFNLDFYLLESNVLHAYSMAFHKCIKCRKKANILLWCKNVDKIHAYIWNYRSLQFKYYSPCSGAFWIDSCPLQSKDNHLRNLNKFWEWLNQENVCQYYFGFLGVQPLFLQLSKFTCLHRLESIILDFEIRSTDLFHACRGLG